MLEVTTTRPTMKLMVDGELAEIPLTFTAKELVRMNAAGDYNEALLDFFGSYVIGFDQLGDDAFNAIIAEWTRLRGELGEPDLGE